MKDKDIFKALNYGLYPKNLPRRKKKEAKKSAFKWCIKTYHDLKFNHFY